MKVYFVFIAALLCVIATCFACLPISFVATFRKQAYNSIDVFDLTPFSVGEIDIWHNARKSDFAQGEFVGGGKENSEDATADKEENNPNGNAADGAIVGDDCNSKTVQSAAKVPFLAECNINIADCYADGVFDTAFENAVNEKLRSGCVIDKNGNVDYRAFGFTNRMQPIKNQNFTAKETIYVLRELISYATSGVQVYAHLEDISIIGSCGVGKISGNIFVDLETLKQRKLLSWLPSNATFSLCVPYTVNGGYVAIDAKDVELCCTSMNLPKTLLMFGCSVAFGNKDYQMMFGQAFENVLINLEISQ